MAIQSDSKKYLYGNGSARLPSEGGAADQHIYQI